MLLRFAALATLGYAGYKLLAARKPLPAAPRVPVAGGPLSDKAVLQSDPDQAPPADLYGDLS